MSASTPIYENALHEALDRAEHLANIDRLWRISSIGLALWIAS